MSANHAEPVVFRRNRPAHFNLGDFLCTPLHYFDFGVREHQTQTLLRGRPHKTILGGGAYNDLGAGQRLPPERTIAWGIGSSHHGAHAEPTPGDDLPYLLYGVRDPDAVTDDAKILPCVSCLHPLAELPAGRETHVYLNHDHGITDLRTAAQAAAFGRSGAVQLYTNRLPELAFVRAFERAGRVVTNSFHVAYWSLLSGRQVAIIGYSSKFRSLLKLVGLSPAVQSHYAVSDQRSLIDAIDRIVTQGDYCQLSNPAAVRRDCRERNLRFARRCAEIGFVPGYALKAHSPAQMRRRHWQYRPIQWVQRLRRER